MAFGSRLHSASLSDSGVDLRIRLALPIGLLVDCFPKALGRGGRRAGRLLSRCAAFTMLEVLFAMAIVGMLITALYAAIATSTSWVRNCQEEQVVTQIMS